jgi:hypothetical protein
MKNMQFIVMIELFSSFLVVGFIHFSKRTTENMAKSYGRNNIKPNDYTMFFEINKESIDHFD